MRQHKLILMGGHPEQLRVPAELLHDALGLLLEGARQAARLFVEGASTRSGPRPAWLDPVCRIDVTSLTAGSAALTLEAPALEEADPARFGEGGQGTLFDDPGRRIAQQTAIDLFGTVLAAVVGGATDDVPADRAILETCSRLARVAAGSFDGVSLEGLSDRSGPVTVRPADAEAIDRLRDQTPDPQAARVTGLLDTISASRAEVLIRLDDGTRLPCRLEAHDPDLLRRLFGGRVVVSGIAHFRPAGQPLLMSVEHLSEARDADALFTAAPTAKARRAIPRSVGQDAASGVASFFGTWPGDESDEALLDALEAIG